jgi:hypothetical protein
MEIVFIDGFLVKLFKLPNSAALSFANSGEGFTYEHDVRQVVLRRFSFPLVVINFSDGHLFKIIPENSVIVLQVLSQVRPEIECLTVRHAELIFTANLHLAHFKFVLYRCSRHTEIFLVQIFNRGDNEFSKPLTTTKCFERVLPIISGINLVCSHSMNVYNMNTGGHLVD